ncbi:MAG: amidohydrolase family protein [Planctomycetota bacterium]|jgi:hypothetical protein
MKQWFFPLALVALAIFSSPALARDEGEDTDRFVAVRAGRIIPVEGEEITDGIIVIRNGRIEAVGKNVEYPRGAEVIHAEDQVIMPGLVNPATGLGIRRFMRSGVHADLKAADEFRLDEELYTDLLRCGFTSFGLKPTGSGFPGQALAFKPAGRDRADWTRNDSAYILMTLTQPAKEKVAFKTAFDTAQKEIEKVEKARKEWEEKQKKKAEEAKAKEEKKEGEEKKEEKDKDKEEDKNSDQESNADHPVAVPEKEPEKDPEKKEPAKEEGKEEKAEVFEPPPISPPYKPLVDLIRKEENVRALVVLDQASDYKHFKEALGDYEIMRAYLLEHASGWMSRQPSSDFGLVAADLGEEKALVVVKPVLNVKPYTSNRMNLPAILAGAACEISFIPANDSLEEHGQHLRRVGQLIRGGLDRDTAMKAVTLHPARVLGLEERVGSLVAGKDADLLFLSGDPFDAKTRVVQVMIQGEIKGEGHPIQ